MTADPNSSAARQQSLGRLLDYALTESGELGLDDVAEFLVLAVASLENRATEAATKKSLKKSSGDTVVDLAEFREHERATTRSPSQSTRT